MEKKSRVLVVGGTGYIGRRIVRASLAEGHPTLVLMRPEIGLDINKLQMLLSFKAQGARLVEASLEDHAGLVAAVAQADVVVSAMSGSFNRTHNLSLQHKLVEAIKDAGNIKAVHISMGPACLSSTGSLIGVALRGRVRPASRPSLPLPSTFCPAATPPLSHHRHLLLAINHKAREPTAGRRHATAQLAPAKRPNEERCIHQRGAEKIPAARRSARGQAGCGRTCHGVGVGRRRCILSWGRSSVEAGGAGGRRRKPSYSHRKAPTHPCSRW